MEQWSEINNVATARNPNGNSPGGSVTAVIFQVAKVDNSLQKNTISQHCHYTWCMG